MGALGAQGREIHSPTGKSKKCRYLKMGSGSGLSEFRFCGSAMQQHCSAVGIARSACDLPKSEDACVCGIYRKAMMMMMRVCPGIFRQHDCMSERQPSAVSRDAAYSIQHFVVHSPTPTALPFRDRDDYENEWQLRLNLELGRFM